MGTKVDGNFIPLRYIIIRLMQLLTCNVIIINNVSALTFCVYDVIYELRILSRILPFPLILQGGRRTCHMLGVLRMKRALNVHLLSNSRQQRRNKSGVSYYYYIVFPGDLPGDT